MPWSKDNLPNNVQGLVSKEKWSAGQIETFVKTANNVLKETGDDGEAIATGIKQARAKQNAVSDVNLTPPKSAKGNAQQVLKWKKEKGDEVKGMTATGWTRARQLASGKSLSPDVVKRMASFARHEKNAKVDPKYKSEPWKDRGYVAWLGWGGTSGIEWAKKKSKELDRAKENQMNGLNLSKSTLTSIAQKLNAMISNAEFKEEDHARDESGKFTSGGSGGSKGKSKEKTGYNKVKDTGGTFRSKFPQAGGRSSLEREKKAVKSLEDVHGVSDGFDLTRSDFGGKLGELYRDRANKGLSLEGFITESKDVEKLVEDYKSGNKETSKKEKSTSKSTPVAKNPNYEKAFGKETLKAIGQDIKEYGADLKAVLGENPTEKKIKQVQEDIDGFAEGLIYQHELDRQTARDFKKDFIAEMSKVAGVDATSSALYKDVDKARRKAEKRSKKSNSNDYTLKVNAKQMPKTYMARHMREGLARYEEENGDDVILVRNEAIRQMCESMQGVPVFVIHQDVDMENLQQQADGYVSKCFYNENDGWWWAEFVAVSDKAHEAISKNWSVSNAYGFEENDVRNESGTYINVPYNREILNGEFNHLAIVPNPRYEDAVIMSPEEYKQYNSQLRDSLENVK